MGSIITLGLDTLELDWGKNSFFRNHSILFAPSEIKQVKYYYVDGVTEEKPAYARPLRNVVKRLDLLGYTLGQCERRYNEQVSEMPEDYPEPALTFEQFKKVVTNVDVERIALPDEPHHYDLGEYVTRNILNDPEFTKTNALLASLKSDDGTFFENLDPYICLRLLAENSANLDREVVWAFADVVESGWVEQDELYEGLADTHRFLVVTEGSSDSAILKRALPLVEPDVVDFFDFVDMSENYPFTGTGNVFRFCQGLARIKIQNRTLIVLDNDTAGHDAAKKIRELSLPANMKVAVLPDLDECNSMLTIGPSGQQREDVNGRAVSIECFLDLRQNERPEPSVRWTSYNEGLHAYHGELVGKEDYTRDFFSAVERNRNYDLSKLALLWRHLLAACVCESA